MNNSVTISGPGANNLAVDGNHASRVFYTNSGKTVTISGLTISGGSEAGNMFPDWTGGGIFNDHATLTVNNCTLSGNSATSDGGGIFNAGESPGSGTLIISNSTLSGNSVTTNGGGGIANAGDFGGHATLTITNCTVSGNSATSGSAQLSPLRCNPTARQKTRATQTLLRRPITISAAPVTRVW